MTTPSSGGLPGPAHVTNMVAVGTVTPTSVRLWMRLERVGRLRLRLHDGDETLLTPSIDVALSPESTCAFTYPDDFFDAAALRPNQRYTFEVEDEVGRLVGTGKFKTPGERAQDAPGQWSLAFLSCHQPFVNDGELTQEARNMLAAVRKAVTTFEPDIILFLGDQVYSDAPTTMSLFEERASLPSVLHQAPHDARRRFDLRYRQAWHAPEWQALHACASTACVVDDHDIVDNWGSLVEHNEPHWQKVRDAALSAAFSWQGERSALLTPGGSFAQAFQWQNAGVILLDVRTQRRMGHDASDSQIIDSSQLERLDTFLRRHAELPVIFVAISVPLVHVPQWISDVANLLPLGGNDLADRWSNPAWSQTRDQMLTMLQNHSRVHPHQQIVLLSGDIHAGWATQLSPMADAAGSKPILQFVSSAITNGEGSIIGALSNAMLRTSKAVSGPVAGLELKHVMGVDKATGNPFGGLNVGLVDVMADSGRTAVRLRLITHGDGLHATEPVVVFDSGPL